MVQTLGTRDQVKHGEDDKIFAVVQQFSKGKKEACWICGESDHYSRDARMTNKTTVGQMVVHGKDAGKGWDIGKSNWNSWENSKGKDWQGSGKSHEWQGQDRQNDWSTPAKRHEQHEGQQQR